MKQRRNVIVIFILILGFFAVGCFGSCHVVQKNSEKNSQKAHISDWINEIGYPLFSSHFLESEGYHFTLEEVNGNVLLTISCDDLVNSLNETNFSQWEGIKNAFCELSESAYHSLLNHEVKGNFIINVISDEKPDEVILSIINGQVIYSISDN